jgi:cell division protein FtsI (penicillin-binding protein 3)
MSGWNPFRKDHPFHYPGQELRAHQRVGRRPPSVMLEGETKRAVETSRTRVLVAAGLFAVVFLAIGGRLVDLMVLKAQDDPSFARRSTSAAEAVLARADITDRNGVVLATNLPTVNLYADATKIVDLDEAADKLAMVLPHLKRQEVHEKLSSGRRFVYIERNLTPRGCRASTSSSPSAAPTCTERSLHISLAPPIPTTTASPGRN